MAIGKPGVVTITDNAGTWTAGDATVTINGTGHTPAYNTTKDQSMTDLATAIATDSDVFSAVYNSVAHTIVITPKEGSQLYVTSDLSGISGSMTFSIATAAAYPTWATDLLTKLEPSGGKKAAGWATSEKPPARWWNWLQNTIYQWIKYFDAGFDPVIETGSFTATFPTAKVLTVRYKLYLSGTVKWQWPSLSGLDSASSWNASGTPVTAAPNIVPSVNRFAMMLTIVGTPALAYLEVTSAGAIQINSSGSSTEILSGVIEYVL